MAAPVRARWRCSSISSWKPESSTERPSLGQQLLGQVVGEAVGVVQLEGVGGVDPGGPGLLRLGDQPLQQLGAALQRAAEALLLVADPAGDRLPLGDQLGVGVAHQLDRALGEAAQPGRLEAERAALLDRPPHDPAQDVAAVLVGGDDAVGDQEGGAARVVGDDPHRPRHRAALVVASGRRAPRRGRSAAARGRSRRPRARPGGSPPSGRGPCRCRCCASAARSACRPRPGRSS